MLRLFLLCSLASSSLAAADDTAYRCTGPTSGPVRVIPDSGGGCRGFTVAKKSQYFTRMTSGTLLASTDGRTVVLVEDYLSANVEKGTVIALVDAEQIINPVVLQIWRDGKRVAYYDIKRLVQDVHKVRESISHVDWVDTMPAVIEAKFTLVTTTGRELTFDGATGKIVDERAVTPKTR